MANARGFPILLMNRYSRGIFYVLNIPDNIGDLYSLPQPVTRVIKSYLQADFPVRIDAPPLVSLFAYDNGTLVVQSFRPEAAVVIISIAGVQRKLRSVPTTERGSDAWLAPVAEPPPAAGGRAGAIGAPQTSFRVEIPAHSYAVFAVQ